MWRSLTFSSAGAAAQSQMPDETLEEIIETTRAELRVLRKWGFKDVADPFEELVKRVEAATYEYRTFVTEKDAVMRTGKSVPWLRSRFSEWERQGNARYNPRNSRERTYRVLVLPVAPLPPATPTSGATSRLAAVVADARAAARGEATGRPKRRRQGV